jgi:putative endonuclease
MFYYVYLLQSDLDQGLYIGFTADLRRRLAEHQQGVSISTKSRRPWRLIYYEAYLQKLDAEGREKFLKSGAGRTFLKKQLRNHFELFPLKPRDLT